MKRTDDWIGPHLHLSRYRLKGSRGATTFSKLGGPISWSRVLSPFYRKIRQVYPVWCNRSHSIHQKLCKSWGSSKFWEGLDPRPPVVLPMKGSRIRYTVSYRFYRQSSANTTEMTQSEWQYDCAQKMAKSGHNWHLDPTRPVGRPDPCPVSTCRQLWGLLSIASEGAAGARAHATLQEILHGTQSISFAPPQLNSHFITIHRESEKRETAQKLFCYSEFAFLHLMDMVSRK